MRHLIAAALTALLAVSAPARGDDMQLVLELVGVSEDIVTSRVALYANDIDPNSSAVGDRFRLEVDGQRQAVPVEFLARLDHARRDFAYDSQSGGIDSHTRQAICMRAGPAVGDLLRVRYLTYRDHAIVSSQMRNVLSEAGNCLFAPQIRPRNEAAHLAAAKALAVLQTLRALNP